MIITIKRHVSLCKLLEKTQKQVKLGQPYREGLYWYQAVKEAL